MDDRTKLKTGASELSIELTDEQLDQFMRYSEMLQDWNTRLNLTRVPAQDIVQLHFLDSLTTATVANLTRGGRLVDVGTGAGLPGLALKIAFPAMRVTLMDSTRKRLDFLEAVIAALGLSEIGVAHARAEEAGRPSEHREAYDFATARAVARLATLSEWLLPLVKPGGAAIALKSTGVDAEVNEARGAIAKLGGEIERVTDLTLPGGDIARKIVVIRKVRRTPINYPRASGIIKAKPLN